MNNYHVQYTAKNGGVTLGVTVAATGFDNAADKALARAKAAGYDDAKVWCVKLSSNQD